MENNTEKQQIIENQDSNSSPRPELLTPGVKKKKKKLKKICWLCKWGCLHVDYKNVEFLKKYLKNNKIVTHKITGNCLKHQHQVATAIKRARIVALLPFVEE